MFHPRLLSGSLPGIKSKKVLGTVVVLGCLGMKEGLPFLSNSPDFAAPDS